MMGKKITLNDNGTTATVEEATVGDVVTSVFDGDVALTGGHKYAQLAIAGVVGAVVQNYRVRGSVQFWQPV